MDKKTLIAVIVLVLVFGAGTYILTNPNLKFSLSNSKASYDDGSGDGEFSDGEAPDPDPQSSSGIYMGVNTAGSDACAAAQRRRPGSWCTVDTKSCGLFGWWKCDYWYLQTNRDPAE